MGIFLAFAQFLLIAIICFQEVKRKSSAVFLWATLMVMFGIMHLLSVLAGTSEYTNQTLNEASMFVIGFCLLYIIARGILCKVFQKQETVVSFYSLEEMKPSRTSYLTLIFVVVSFFICWNLISFSGGILDTSWSTGRDYSATLDYANTSQVNNILYFALSGLPFLLWILHKRKMSIVCLIIITVVTIVSRNRILVLPLLVFFLAIFVLKIKTLKMRHIIFAGVAGILVIYIVYGLRVFRHYGTIEVFLRDFNLSEFVNRINLYIVTDNGELGLRNDFYFFVQNDNQFSGFGEWATYMRMLFVYIPTRFSFGLKPDDFAQTMGAAIGMVKGGSTHPTLFGDCYANAGSLGIFLGAFWALYCSVADHIVQRFKNQALKVLTYCLFAVTFVIIGRGSVYNSFFFVAWGIPALWLIVTIFEKMPRIKITLR